MADGPAPPTTDALLHGRLVLRQPAHGHRVNLDAVLLAAFAATASRPPRDAAPPGAPPFPRAADLGAGTGAVGLLLRRAGIVGTCLLIEAEPALAALAADNAAANGLADAVHVHAGDLRAPLPRAWLARCDLVVANPPYLSLDAGRASPEPLRAAQRHELRGGLPEFLAAARALLRPAGAFAAIYPWRRRAQARAALDAAGWRVARERLHRAHAGGPAGTFCVEAFPPQAPAAPTGTIVEEVVVHAPGRRFSELVERFLDGDYASAPRIADSGIAPARTMR